jgi:hypothetical protein
VKTLDKEIILVSRISTDKWFNLPFILAMRDKRLQEVGLSLTIIGCSDAVSERLLNLEIKYSEVENYINRVPQNIKWEEIVDKYSNNLFVTGSNQGFLGNLGEDVIDAKLLLTCYNIGFDEMNGNLMFANNQLDFRKNLFNIFNDSKYQEDLRLLNDLHSRSLLLTKDDRNQLDILFKLNNKN